MNNRTYSSCNDSSQYPAFPLPTHPWDCCPRLQADEQRLVHVKGHRTGDREQLPLRSARSHTETGTDRNGRESGHILDTPSDRRCKARGSMTANNGGFSLRKTPRNGGGQPSGGDAFWPCLRSRQLRGPASPAPLVVVVGGECYTEG